MQNDPKNNQHEFYVQVSKDDELVNIDSINVNESITLQTLNYKFKCEIMKKVKIS